jgi:O-antigen ligase
MRGLVAHKGNDVSNQDHWYKKRYHKVDMMRITKSFLHNGSRGTAFVARIFFALTIVLMPLRFRYVLLERPLPDIYHDFTDFLLFGSDITLLLLLVSWVLSLLLAPRSLRFGPKFLWIPMSALILTSLGTAFTSLDVALSLYHTVRLIALFVFYLYIINEIHSALLIYISAAIQVITQALVALAQFFLQHSIGLQAFGEHILDPQVLGVSIVSTGYTRVLRAYGLTESPNVLGGCLAFCLILLFSLYIYGEQRRRRGLSLIILLGLLGLFVTFSRSAWLALFSSTAILVWALIASRDWQKLKSFAWLGIISIILLLPLVWGYSGYVGARLNYGDSYETNRYENQSIQLRLALNSFAIHIFLDKPFTGIGLGAAALAVKKYYSQIFVPPHFVLLVVAMETGILGLVSYLSSLFLPFVILARKRIKLHQRPMLLTACALIIAMSVVGLFDIYPWLFQPGRLWQWLAWGFWVLAYEGGSTFETEPTLN